MSYCRSGDDSDVYLYGTKTELTLHVALNRGPAKNLPSPYPDASIDEIEAFMNDVLPLNHPAAGGTHTFTSRAQCLAWLADARNTGLRVPQRALDRLRQEIVTEGDSYP